MLSIYSNPSVHLPRTLSRPHFNSLSIQSVLPLDPDLSNLPPEYIRRRLRLKAPMMQAGISSLSIPASLPPSHIPSSFTLPVRHSPNSQNAPIYPTHVLALSSSSPTKHSHSDHLPLFPIHAILLASHCASLPRLPPTPHSHSTSLSLPVLPLSIPSPAAFSILHSYLYTHSLQLLLSSLLPLPSSFTHSLSTQHAHSTLLDSLASGPVLHQLSTYLCAHSMSNLQTLTSHASHVTAFWKNCAALAVCDPELWDAMDLAWEVVLGALNLATAAH